MNTSKSTFLIFLIFFTSCGMNKKDKVMYDFNYEPSEITHNIIWVSKKINNYSKIEYEYIINQKNDSFLNQMKVYENGVIDTLKSKFYSLNIIKNNGLNHSGRIYYRNNLDTLNLEINKNRWIFFYLEQQIEKDSIAHKIFTSNDGNNIYYEYSNFENGYISGYIEDIVLIPTEEKDSLGRGLKRLIEKSMNIQRRIELD